MACAVCIVMLRCIHFEEGREHENLLEIIFTISDTGSYMLPVLKTTAA